MERLHCGHLRCPCLLQVYQSKWFLMIWSIVSERNKYDFFITGKSGTSQVTSSSSNSTTSPPTGPNGPMTTNSGASVKENRYRHLLCKNSWNFVYIQAIQCRTPFILTRFFYRKFQKSQFSPDFWRKKLNGFTFEVNVARLRNETFWVIFKHC